MTIPRTPTNVACIGAFVGPLLVCTYPGVGTALAWELGLSDTTWRRSLQASMLVLGIAGLWLGSFRRPIPRDGRVMRPALVAAVIGVAVPLCAASARGFSGWGGCPPSPPLFAVLACGTLWCAASAVWVLSAGWRRSAADQASAASACSGLFMQRLLALCGALLAVHVWIRGPGHDDGSVHLSMGGNQSFLAVFFLTCTGLVAWRRGWVGVLSSIPWMYLSIATTSRLTLLLVPLIACVVPMSRVPRHGRPWGWADRRLALGPLFVSIAVAFMVAPVSLFGIPLPYLDSAGNIAHAREWSARQGRAGRMIAPFVPDALGAIDSPAWRDAAYSARVPDDRLQMWKASLAAIGSRPLGSWPCGVQLETLVRLPDGSGMNHSYTSPHNLCLELGLRFGWGAGLLALMGALGLAWMAVRVLATTCDAGAACAAIGCIVELSRAQFSGDLWDGLGLLVAGCIVTFAYRTGSVVASDSCRSNAVPGP